MADDRGEIGIADFVQGISFGEGVRLDPEVVIVGDALDRRLGIVATLAVLVVESASERLLVTEGDLFNLQFHLFVGFVDGRGNELVTARHTSESHVGRDLAAGIGKPAGGIECYPWGRSEFDQSSGDDCSLLVVYLDYDWLRQPGAGLRELFSAAGFDDCGAEGRGLGQRCGFGLTRTGSSQRCCQHRDNEGTDCMEVASHFLATSGLAPPFCEIRNAVRARASSSVMPRFGSTVPGRRACGFVIHW